MAKQTVFPTRAGAFPPASFFNLGDAMGFAFQCAKGKFEGGVNMCPPASFEMHWAESEKRPVAQYLGTDNDGLAAYQLPFQL